MKRILFPSLFVFFMVACSDSNQESSEKNINQWEINSQGIGTIELGKLITETKEQLLSYQFEIEEQKNGGYDVLEDGSLLVHIAPAYGDRIDVIEIYTDKWKTKNGIKVGMSIEEIKNIRKDFTPQMDKTSGRFSFAPIEMQTSNSKLAIYFVNKDDSPVWDFKKTPDENWFNFSPVGEVDNQAIVEIIIIFKYIRR